MGGSEGDLTEHHHETKTDNMQGSFSPSRVTFFSVLFPLHAVPAGLLHGTAGFHALAEAQTGQTGIVALHICVSPRPLAAERSTHAPANSINSSRKIQFVRNAILLERGWSHKRKHAVPVLIGKQR